MPRLRPAPKATEPVPSLRDLLAERGAFARCTATHTSRAGFIEKGTVRPLGHPTVEAAPEYFDIVVAAARLKGT